MGTTESEAQLTPEEAQAQRDEERAKKRRYEKKVGPAELYDALDTAPVSQGFRDEFRKFLDHVEELREQADAEDSSGS